MAQLDSGRFQATIDENSGKVSLAGPDLEGRPLANVVTLEPSNIHFANQRTVSLGRVVGLPRKTADHLEIDQELGGAKATARITFPSAGVMRYEVVDWGGPAPLAATISATSDASESFFGFGERFNALNQAGRLVKIRTFDQPRDKFDAKHPQNEDFTYKTVPWFMSSRGYGFHLDSSVESEFDMRKTAANRYIVRQPFIPDRSPGLALHLISGPKLTDVLSRYTDLTGRPPLPPPWAFGPWISADVWRNGGEVRYVVQKTLERGIPASAFVFDSPWEFAYNDFTFNIKDGPQPDPATQFGSPGQFENQPEQAFKDYDGFKSLAEMMGFLQTSGLKVVCWMTPFTNDESIKEKAGEKNEAIKGQLQRASNFDEGVNKGVFIQAESDGSEGFGVHWWKGHGSHIDFTNPAAREWLKGQLVQLIDLSRVTTKSGAREPAICGFKTDDGEASTTQGNNHNPSGDYLSKQAKYFDPGVTPEEMRNRYCVEYHKTVYNVVRDAVGPEKGLIFARSGFHGTQAFPGCWAGDNQPNFKEANGLPSVIVAGLSAALSGFSIWSHDIGGYQKDYEPAPTDSDLFMRWTQFGCFTPIMQMHRQLSAPPPPGKPPDHPHGQYPWGYVSNQERTDPTMKGKEFVDNEALRNYRFYARLHTQLFPYIYTHAKEASATGLPIMRPLVLLHQDDRTTFGIKHTYYFGNALLVAPVIEPNKTTRHVYLPRGQWIDYWTNQRIDRSGGGSNHTWSNSDRTKLPLFVREGAIIPMLLEIPQTLCDANYVNNSGIRTPSDDLLFRIYPGGTSAFTVYDGTTLTCEALGTQTKVVLDSSHRKILLQVLGPRPTGVARDGIALTEQPAADRFAAAPSAWRHDSATGFTLVKFGHGGGRTQITL